MRVFITGATGLIGSAVSAELLAHGHTIIGLARSEASADKLRAAGIEPLRGELADLDVLRAGASAADGVIHLAFGHDFSSAESITRAVEQDAAALAIFADELRGSGKPLVAVAGTPAVPGRASTEADPLPTEGPVGGRSLTVEALLADDALRATVVRLPRTVHNDGTGGFAGMLTQIARQTGVAGYPGDGAQRWPAVHVRDAAALFRLALEAAPAGTSWHAVGDEGDAVREIVAVIGRRLGLPVQPLPAESFGPLGPIFATDQPASSALTQEALGWTPTHPSLLADLENITS